VPDPNVIDFEQARRNLERARHEDLERDEARLERRVRERWIGTTEDERSD
jgi:hypothetical protein